MSSKPPLSSTIRDVEFGLLYPSQAATSIPPTIAIDADGAGITATSSRTVIIENGTSTTAENVAPPPFRTQPPPLLNRATPAAKSSKIRDVDFPQLVTRKGPIHPLSFLRECSTA
jgi:hypothetical protein